jgi:hypothetical protein
MSAQLAFIFGINATFEEVSAAVALHFGGKPTNLATGEEAEVPLRDASAVFTGTSKLTTSSGATPATAAPTVEVDAEGLPWDERIHSSSKAKNDNGNWKMKKGVANSNLLQVVRAELLSKRSGGSVPAAAVTQTAQTAAPAADQVSMQNSSDAAIAARIAYAEDQATVAAGPRTMVTDEQFAKLKKGQMVDVLQAGLDWFNTWRAAFDAAYQAYGQQSLAQSATNTPPAMPAAPAAPAPAAITDLASFAPFYATKIVVNPANNAVFEEVCGMFNVQGFAGLSQNPAMIPAVVSLLQTRGVA